MSEDQKAFEALKANLIIAVQRYEHCICNMTYAQYRDDYLYLECLLMRTDLTEIEAELACRRLNSIDESV